MIHVFYDPIKDGSFTKPERLDCTVRALAIATGMSYAQAHSLCEQRGRRYGRRFHCDRLAGTGVFVGAPVKRHGTVLSFLKKFPVGRFYVTTSNHAFAVIDGRIWDTYFDPERRLGNRRVAAAWRVRQFSVMTEPCSAINSPTTTSYSSSSTTNCVGVSQSCFAPARSSASLAFQSGNTKRSA